MPSFITHRVTEPAASATPSFLMPASVTAGDKALIIINGDGKSVNAGPAGWTERKELLGPGPFAALALWTKDAALDGTEGGASLQFTLSASDNSFGIVIILRNADFANLVIGAGNTANSTGPVQADSINAASGDNMILALAARDNVFGTVENTTPSGYTSISLVGTVNGPGLFAAYKVQVASGATGAVSWGSNAAAADWTTFLVAVPPPVTAVPDFSYTRNFPDTFPSPQVIHASQVPAFFSPPPAAVLPSTPVNPLEIVFVQLTFPVMTPGGIVGY